MRASYGLLAQLVEQRTLNPFVAGSIPAQPTNKKGLAEMRGLLFFSSFQYPSYSSSKSFLKCSSTLARFTFRVGVSNPFSMLHASFSREMRRMRA